MLKIEVRAGENYNQALERTVSDLPLETKSEIRRLLIEEQLKVGDICDRLQLETMIVATVICNNIAENKFLKTNFE